MSLGFAFLHSHKIRFAREKEDEADDHEAAVSALPGACLHNVLMNQSPPGKEDGRVEDREGGDSDRELHLVLPQRRNEDDVLRSALVLTNDSGWRRLTAMQKAPAKNASIFRSDTMAAYVRYIPVVSR